MLIAAFIAGSVFPLSSEVVLTALMLKTVFGFADIDGPDTALMAPRVPKRGEIVLFFDISVFFQEAL